MNNSEKQRSIAIFITTTMSVGFIGFILAMSNLTIGSPSSSREDLLFSIGLFLFLGSPIVGAIAAYIFKQKRDPRETDEHNPELASVAPNDDGSKQLPTVAKQNSKIWLAAAIIALVLFGIPMLQFFGGLVVTGIQNSYYKDKELKEHNQAKAKLEADNKAYEATQEQPCVTASEIMDDRSYNLRNYVLVINERGSASDKDKMSTLTQEIDDIRSLCRNKQITSYEQLTQITPVVNQIKDLARRIISGIPQNDLKPNEKNL